MGDRSQTWTKVSSNGVLLINIAIAIFPYGGFSQIWSHISNMCNKTSKLIGLFYRTFYKHSSNAWSHLESVWDPHLRKDIVLFEDTQKFALKVCNKSELRRGGSQVYSFRITGYRRRQFKLCQAYMTLHYAPLRIMYVKCNSRTVYSQALIPIQTHLSQLKHSFLLSVIEQCNLLPENVTSSSLSFQKGVSMETYETPLDPPLYEDCVLCSIHHEGEWPGTLFYATCWRMFNP